MFARLRRWGREPATKVVWIVCLVIFAVLNALVQIGVQALTAAR